MQNLSKTITTLSLMVFATTPVFADSTTELKDAAAEKLENIKTAIEAIESGDYETWYNAVEGKKITEIINEDNFENLVEAHELKKDGEIDAAKEMFEELGIKPAHKKRFKDNKNNLHKKAILEAINSGDYNAWLEAVGENSKATDLINEDNFDQLSEAHELAKNGEKDTAKEIFEELGFKHPKKLLNNKSC
jgi:hypothetical protein